MLTQRMLDGSGQYNNLVRLPLRIKKLCARINTGNNVTRLHTSPLMTSSEDVVSSYLGGMCK